MRLCKLNNDIICSVVCRIGVISVIGIGFGAARTFLAATGQRIGLGFLPI